MTDEVMKGNKKVNYGILGASVAAIGASLCCIGPLVLLSLGISGAWISNLTSLDPYRPFFVAITIAFLGYAFYNVYKNSDKKECKPGSYCAYPQSKKINKISLWVITILASVLLVTPYVLPYLYE